MADDFGDDAGGKLVDWMVRIGETAGTVAAFNAAHRFKSALENAQGEVAGEASGEGSPAVDDASQWAKLDMAEFKEIDGWDELEGILAEKLEACGVEHEIVDMGEDGKTWLLFKTEDAGLLAAAFGELSEQTDIARAEAEQALSRSLEQEQEQEREQTERMKEGREERSGRTGRRGRGDDPRDAEALESKAEAARRASAELERHDHGTPERAREIGREQVRAR